MNEEACGLAIVSYRPALLPVEPIQHRTIRLLLRFSGNAIRTQFSADERIHYPIVGVVNLWENNCNGCGQPFTFDL